MSQRSHWCCLCGSRIEEGEPRKVMPDNGPEDPQTLVRELPLKWYAKQSYAHSFCQRRLRENGKHNPVNLNCRIRIPFRLDFAKALFSGTKTATSRTKRYGIPGDTFVVSGREFVLTAVYPTRLRNVAGKLWKREGCSSESEFVKIWKGIHPRKGWDPEQVVFVHEFEMVKTARDLLDRQRVVGTTMLMTPQGAKA